MAYRINNGATNLSSTTGWDTVTNVPTIHASTGLSVGTSAIYSAAFTAPNLVNKSTGAAVLVTTFGYSNGGASMTHTMQLQEYNGSVWSDVAGATASITTNFTAAFSAPNWVYFRWGTPYTFTTTNAGYYRVKILRGAATGASTTIRADSGAANFAYMHTDDRTGAIGGTDDLLALGTNFADTTVTLDGTVSWGSGLNAGVVETTPATLSCAFYVGAHALVVADTTANVTTLCKGHIMHAWGGSFTVGTAVTPYPIARQFKWQFNPTTTGDFAYRMYDGTLGLWGAPKTSTTLWKTTYVSGLGTAASPLVVADAVDWSVGDEIAVLAASNSSTNYNELEYRFIITKNSSTSYVLSSTSGGAENALLYDHTNANGNADVLVLSRNILFTTNDITKGAYYKFSNAVIAAAPSNGTIDIQWTRFDTLNGPPSLLSSEGFQVINTYPPTAPPNTTYSWDYCVLYRHLNGSSAGWYGNNNNATVTNTGIIVCRQPNGSYGVYGQNFENKTFNDWYIVDCAGVGLMSYATSCTWNRLNINACRKGSTANANAGIQVALSSNLTFNDLEISACGTAIYLNGACAGLTFNRAKIGRRGYSAGADLAGNNLAYCRAVFNDCTFYSPNLWFASSVASYKALGPGTEVVFDRFGNVDNVHKWYTNYGSAQSTGAGLSDTTVRTAGTLNLRLAPEDATYGISWSYKVLAVPGKAVLTSGFIQRNAAFGSDTCTVELFLPGSTVADASYTMPTTTGVYLPYTLIASYAGSVNRYATVVITAKSATASAYVYIADIMNGTNDIINMKTWDQGKPSAIMFEQLGDALGVAAAVWQDTQASHFAQAGSVGAALFGSQSEPGQGAPSASASALAKLAYLYKAWRNKKTQNALQWSLFADDAVTVDQKASVSDDGATATRGEVGSGP